MITSTANFQIKEIRRLIADRRERERLGLYVVEGLRIVGEAFQMEAPIEQLVVAPELLVSDFGLQIVDHSYQRGVPQLKVSASVFHSLSIKEGPQGIAAVIRQKWADIEKVNPTPGHCWVALDSIADPGNLGTILRTNDGAGGEGIILLGHCTDPYDPTALRASMGAVFSQKLVRASFEDFSHWRLTQACPVVGTSDKSELDYHYAEYPDRLVLLMGSERAGLPDHYLRLCDWVVSIPMLGRSDSLNLAVATGISLYEIYNQYRDRNKPSRRENDRLDSRRSP